VPDLYRSYVVRVRRSIQSGSVRVQVEDLLLGRRREVTGTTADQISRRLEALIDVTSFASDPAADPTQARAESGEG
jgi:hypothetical protein